MALAIPPSFIAIQTSGDACGLTFYRDKKQGQVAYQARQEWKKPSGGCIHRVVVFRQAVEQWVALPYDQRWLYSYLAKAGKYPMTGLNLWVSLCLRPSHQLQAALARMSPYPLVIPNLL